MGVRENNKDRIYPNLTKGAFSSVYVLVPVIFCRIYSIVQSYTFLFSHMAQKQSNVYLQCQYWVIGEARCFCWWLNVMCSQTMTFPIVLSIFQKPDHLANTLADVRWWPGLRPWFSGRETAVLRFRRSSSLFRRWAPSSIGGARRDS